MSNPRHYILLAFVLFLAGGSVSVTAQTSDTTRAYAVPVKLDPAGDQTLPGLVIDRQERMLVVWLDTTYGERQIMVQSFDRMGGRLGPEIPLRTSTALSLTAPSVALNSNETAVVAWQEAVDDNQRVFVRRCLTSGQLLGNGPLLETSTRLLYGISPAVAVDTLGNAILVSQGLTEDSNIFGTWIAYDYEDGEANKDSAVFAWKGNITVNQSTGGKQTDPAVAMDRKGNFVVVWRDSSAAGVGIGARVFVAGGIDLVEFRIPQPGSVNVENVSAPSIAAASIYTDSTGFLSDTSFFLVSWINYSNDGNSLVLARVSIDKMDNVAQDTVNWTIRDTLQVVQAWDKPVLSGNYNGDAVLIWREKSACGSTLYSTGFNLEQGLAPGNNIVALTPDSCDQLLPELANPAMAIKQSGGFAVVWEEHDSSGGVDLLMQSYTSEGGPEAPLFIVPGIEDEVVDRSVALVGHPDGGFSMFWERETTGLDTYIERILFSADGKSLNEGNTLAVLAEDYDTQSRPVAARNSRGSYLVAWQEKNSSGSYLLRAASFGADDRQSADVVIEVEESDDNYLSDLDVWLGEDGRSYFVWERWQPESSAPELVLARLDSGATKINDKAVVVESSSGGGRLASVAVDSSGYQMVVWRQGAASGVNASIRGKLYDPDGGEEVPDIQISEQRLGYLGSMGHPVVASSLVSEDFLVVWQEFFGESQRLYYSCYYYDTDGERLEVRGSPRRSINTGGESTSNELSQTSPAITVDTLGNYLVLWAEKERGGPVSLRGSKLSSQAETIGGIFRVPGVEMAALPVIGSLGDDRFAIAWQDTVGSRMRTMAQVVEIDFHKVGGLIVLAGAVNAGLPVVAHIEGNVNDSITVDNAGRFSFPTLVAGSYSIWFSSGGSQLYAELSEFELQPEDPKEIDLGTLIVGSLSSTGQLPRAGRMSLYQNVPNPFNPSTTISFDLGDEAGLFPVDLDIYDLRGRLVAGIFSGSLEAGFYSFIWDGKDSRGRPVASGVYFYRLKAGAQVAVRKMIMIK
jgi:FlgD Ig-like domain